MKSRLVYVHDCAVEAMESLGLLPIVKPVVQRDPAQFPSVVYYGIAVAQIPTTRGPSLSDETIRVESRATTFLRARELDDEVVQKLKRGGRLLSIFSGVDTSETDAKESLIFRRITGVRIR